MRILKKDRLVYRIHASGGPCLFIEFCKCIYPGFYLYYPGNAGEGRGGLLPGYSECGLNLVL